MGREISKNSNVRIYFLGQRSCIRRRDEGVLNLSRIQAEIWSN